MMDGCWMDEWMDDGRIDGWTIGRIDGLMVGWMDDDGWRDG